MAVKHEIKSQLAKLLATEDLVIEHKQIETAQFNVQTRVLILPLWEKATNEIYDALVAHEVGHALYTPDQWDWMGKVPQSFVNIVEDVRIEKLMKRRYAGLAKTFYKGYNELNDLDFFDINDKDLTDFNLADRVNLYFKVGAWNDISFSDAETPIVNLIKNAETFDEAVSAAEALYNFCKEDNKEETESQEQKVENNVGMDLEGNGNSSDIDSDDTDTTVPESDSDAPMESRSDSNVDNNRMDGAGASVEPVEPETKTVDALDQALKNLVGEHSRENVYVEVPELDLDNVIISNEDIHDRCELNWLNWEYNYKETIARGDLDLYGEVDSDYKSFKKSAQKEVNFLVKEFEMKKSADSYARSTIAKTGVLNTSKLHTYKFNEDLFKKVNVVPDGKNHGLIFILDWSGSMAEVMTDTLKQLYNLIWFCRKVNIPFDVYGFTNEALIFNSDEEDQTSLHERIKPIIDKEKGFFAIDNYFGMLHLFTSKVNSKVLDRQMVNIYRTSEAFRRGVFYRYPQGLHLSGTPLNESLVALHQILPKFKSDNKLQKVQCVILTDGEAYPLKYYREVERHWEDEPYLGTGSCGDNVSLRDRKLGKTYNFSYEYYSFTDTMLRHLGDKFPDTNFIGMRIMSGRDAGSFIRRYIDPYKEEKKYGIIMKSWKTNKSFSIKDSGYSTYFGLLSNSLSEDDIFEVNEDATKAQIKRAFVKSLKTKKLNKKVLGEFVEMVV